MTDAELIDGFHRGNVEALNTLVRRWHGRIYNFVLRYVGDRDDAQDVAQKVFISAHTNIRSLHDANRFQSWLYRIALNACRDEARRAARRNTFSLDGPEDETPQPTAKGRSPEHLVEQADVRETLRRALQAIPEEQRVVVVMKEYEGLKFREIADALEIPVNTAKSRLYYGLTALKKVLDQWQVTEEMLRYEP